MITILVDHTMEGQATLFGGTLVAAGWSDLVPLRRVTFTEYEIYHYLESCTDLWKLDSPAARLNPDR